MKTICFAGLLSDTNLGDVVIFQSTESLYKEALEKHGTFKFNKLDLKPKKPGLLLRIIRKIRRLIINALKLDPTRFEVNLLKKYYRSQVDSVDLIVVVGGGLIKYKYQNFHFFLTALAELTEELGASLIINAAGVEGYDENDPRCQTLKRSLNKAAVKSVTTRDDIQTLSKNYINKDTNKHIAKVADSAVYANEIYNQKKQPSQTYGIGLVRENIFLDNDIPLQPDEVADFYAKLILELESRGLTYKLFTNGLPADNELLPAIRTKSGLSDLALIEPLNSKELIGVISSFATVIAARLHANIIAYALDIPSVGLVWNDKLKLFGHDIGYPERFFEHSLLNAEHVIDAAVLAKEQGYDLQQRLNYKSTAKSNIEYLVSKWLTNTL